MSVDIDTTAEEIGTDLEHVTAQSPVALFGTTDPVEIIERAGVIAAALKDVLRNQQMVSNIKGKEYVKVEGWQTLASMLGVTPVVAWTRPVDGGWEARVEVHAIDGRVIGAAESMCVEAEGGNWGSRSSGNARRSMAQTRATSKALRGPLGFVVTLAGYQATPAEEMPTGDVEPERTSPMLGDAGRTKIRIALAATGLTEDDQAALLRKAGFPDVDQILTVADAHAMKAAMVEAGVA